MTKQASKAVDHQNARRPAKQKIQSIIQKTEQTNSFTSDFRQHIYSQFILGTRRQKQRMVQGGSNHALDTMLESEMQNKRKTKTVRVPIIFE
jgi:hypothetical protein